MGEHSNAAVVKDGSTNDFFLDILIAVVETCLAYDFNIILASSGFLSTPSIIEISEPTNNPIKTLFRLFLTYD